MKKILIIQTASIGDVILSTSLLEKLHSFYPDAKIDFLTKSSNRGIFIQHPFLNKLILWDKSKNKFLNFIDVINSIREEKYDLLVNLHRFFSSGLITLFSHSKIKIGFNKNPLSIFYSKRYSHYIKFDGNIHEIERNHELIKEFTDNVPGSVALHPSVSDRVYVSSLKTKPYICIAPASLWFTKQFPVEKWVELLNNVPKLFVAYILGSKADMDISQKIIYATENQNCINLCGKLSLLQSASLMQNAIMNFVNDSSPMHIASAVDAPVCAIYCSTVPEFGFKPLSNNSFIIETDEKLKCRPCGIHGRKSCKEKHFYCAKKIDVKKLIDKI